MTGDVEELKPLVLSCLDENPKVRPVTAEVLEKVKINFENQQANEKRVLQPANYPNWTDATSHAQPIFWFSKTPKTSN